jgi:hypothetical protein
MPTSEQAEDVKFVSPSALWEFALETATQLRQAEMKEAGDRLESAARYVTSSGSEWLGELGAAAANIRKQFKLSKEIASRVRRIQKAATSRRPYG